MWIPIRVEQFLKDITEGLGAIQNLLTRHVETQANDAEHSQQARNQERRSVWVERFAERQIRNRAYNETRTNNEKSHQQQKVQTSIGIIGVSGGVFVAIFALLQWHEMTKATLASQRAAEVAARAFKESQWQFYFTSKSNQEQFERDLKQIQAQTAAQQQTAKSSSDAVQATKDAMYLEQRPWVAIEIVSVPPASAGIKTVEGGTTLTGFVAVAHNTGRTPAVHAREECCEVSSEDSSGVLLDYDTLHADIDRNISEADRQMIREGKWTLEAAREWIRRERSSMDADTSASRVIPPNGIVPLADRFQTPPAGGLYHFTVGKFVYSDVLDRSKEHVTKFCILTVGNSSHIELCRFGNDMQ